MSISVRYFYRDESAVPGFSEDHQRACALLQSLLASGKVVAAHIEREDIAFPTSIAKQTLFDTLERHAIERQVGLARVFGSRKRGFCYLPPHFALLYEGDHLDQVFPFRINRAEVGVVEGLNRLCDSRAWTTSSVRSKRNTAHRALADVLMARQEWFAPGVFVGADVPVSRSFSERGRIDLLWEYPTGDYLLVEVKATMQELDKAIGQVLRHRDLFIEQNHLEPSKVKAAVACPIVPESSRRLCASLGIGWIQLPQDAETKTLLALPTAGPIEDATSGR